MISYAPPAWSPEWFNDGMFATGISLVCTAVAVWLILELHQRAVINQESIILRFDVGSWIPIITKYYYAMFIVVGILAFPLGVWFSPSQSQDHTNPMSLSIDSHRKTAIAQRDDLIPLLSDQSDVVIPLTPERLIDIARTQTTRDAMSYKGALIHFQGNRVEYP